MLFDDAQKSPQHTDFERIPGDDDAEAQTYLLEDRAAGQQAPLAPAGPVGGTAPLWPPPVVAAAAVPRWLPLLLRSYPLLNKLCIPVSETAKLRLTWACVFAEAVLCVCICKGINLLFHNVSCGGLFRCGCTWDWAGGWTKCNVHNATGPKCPFCNASPGVVWLTADWFFMLLMMCVWLWVLISTRRRKHSYTLLAARMLASFASFPFLFTLVGLAFFVGTDYPYFLWFTR